MTEVKPFHSLTTVYSNEPPRLNCRNICSEQCCQHQQSV